MNKIITQNQKNIKRYLPHEIKTRENAVKMYRNCNDIGYVCRKYHIPMVVLGYLTPKEKREELKKA